MAAAPARGPEGLPADLLEGLGEFLTGLEREGGLSASTTSSYGRDLQAYLAHAAGLGVRRISELTAEAADGHVAGLVEAGRSPATVARTVSSMRRFHEFLRITGRCLEDPTAVPAAAAGLRAGSRIPSPWRKRNAS